MKKTITIFAMICSIITFGQTAQEHYNKGNEKANAQNFSGSIKDYDKAIKLDAKYTDAYYNRGTSKMYNNDYKGAIADYDKAIELNPDFLNAYTNRGVAKLKSKELKGAIQDYDYAIKLDPTNSSAYFMRAQVKLQSGDKDGGCSDLTKSKELGDKRAEKIIEKYCENQPASSTENKIKESLSLDWPESENWKIGSNQENEQMTLIELIHTDETLEKWTELGSMMSIKGIKNVPMDEAMNMMFDQSKKDSPKAKLTFIEKDESVEFPWIIFTIEAPYFKKDKTPESQLWYIVQGKTSLYTNFRAVKQATVPAEQKGKWTTFFKTGKIIYK